MKNVYPSRDGKTVINTKDKMDKNKLVMCLDCQYGTYKGKDCSTCSLELDSSLKTATYLRKCNFFKSKI